MKARQSGQLTRLLIIDVRTSSRFLLILDAEHPSLSSCLRVTDNGFANPSSSIDAP
jgi:hypothetical protein